jgi:hypothetical protein
MQPAARTCANRNRVLFRAFLCVSIWLCIPSANAVLFYSTGDPNHNTTAPTGSLTNSGWQFEGIWGSFLGTPIAPKYFMSAEHIGGSVGDIFTFNSVQYATTAVYDDPSSDLRIWRVCGTFPTFAQIYTNSNEVNDSKTNGMIVIGRGTQRGGEVTTSTTNIFNQVTVKTNGWFWGPSDGVERWGTNVVAAIVNGDGILGGGSIGEVLQATFDMTGGSEECHLSVGDSAGGVFIKDGAAWKLAGINYAVDGPYNTSTNGSGFNAAIFDEGGLYVNGTTGWSQVTDFPPNQPTPGSFYSTRVSAHVAWIDGIINGAAPNDSAPVLQSASSVTGTYGDEAGASVDDVANTITIALPAGSRFYRLRACGPLTINSIQVQGGNLVLGYQ